MRSGDGRRAWTRSRRTAGLLGGVLGVLFATLAPVPSASAVPTPPRPIGGLLAIDVPAQAGRFLDINPFRAGTQVLAVAVEDPRAGRIRLVSLLDRKVLAEGATEGFGPRGSLWAGWRAFIWGLDGSGQARLWSPAFDSARSFLSLDPSLPCGTATDAATPLAGPFPITIPAGARPGGHAVESPTDAFVFGNPADPAKGVRIASAGGVDLGGTRIGANVAQGGFGFGGAAFAYGTARGEPTLWTPELLGTSTRLRSLPFVACTSTPPPAQGTITVTKKLVPASDSGRFDLQVDGATVAAAASVGDGGSTGPVTVPAGDHSVSEVAAEGTGLGDYTSEIRCTEDSSSASPLDATATSLAGLTVAAGDDWQCTITNTRRVDPGSLTVQSSPDTAHAAAETVGALGGTIETTAADGTDYSLFVPPGALASEVEITVTPTAVAGLESIATAAPFAVELAPSGLTFATPARLTITPAAGTPAVDFAASWQNGAPGVTIVPLRANPADGSLTVEVAHFSGVASIKATIHAYNTLLTLALVSLPDYQGLRDQLRLDAAGLPGTETAVVSDVQRIYNDFIVPYLNAAGDGLLEFRLASRRLAEFETLYQLLPIGGVQVTGPPGPTTLQDLLDGAVGLFIDRGTVFVGKYTTACDGQVGDLADWFAIPILATAELEIRGVELPHQYCARATIDTISWSNRITPTQTTVNGAIRGVIEAPGQTPGGILKDGKKLFPQPTQFVLHSSGAAFPGGGNDLDQITADDGRLDFQLDRASGTQGVVVDGTGQVTGFTAEIIAVDSSFEETLPVHLVASTGTITVAFRSPPTNTILPYGQTTNLCVDVYDGDGVVITDETVTWTLTGPGSLAAATSTTNSLGVACVDYDHPAGPVTQGDTAQIQASVTHDGDTGNTSVTLTPDWAHIEIETRPASQSSFSTTTNSSVHVQPGELVQLTVTITGPGATPSDPPQPLPAGRIVQIEVDNGGGLLSDDADPSNQAVRVLSFVDANGQAHLTWDPAGTTLDTTIRVSYPDLTLTGVPGVTATVTFTHGAPVQVTITPASVALSPGGTTTFTATVTGATDTTVTWSTSGGTIDQQGNYTAPQTLGSYTVTATSNEDPTSLDTATVTLGHPLSRLLIGANGGGRLEAYLVGVGEGIGIPTISWPVSDPAGFVAQLNTALSGVSEIGYFNVTVYEPVNLALSLGIPVGQVGVSSPDTPTYSGCGSTVSVTVGDVRSNNSVTQSDSTGAAVIAGCFAHGTLRVGDVEGSMSIGGSNSHIQVTAGNVGGVVGIGSQYSATQSLVANLSAGTIGGLLMQVSNFSAPPSIAVGDVLGNVVISNNSGLSIDSIIMGNIGGYLTITANGGFSDPEARDWADARTVGGTTTIWGNLP